jgi:Holliday junction resolvase RusA-like endonuclease
MQYAPSLLAGTGCPRTNSGQHDIEGTCCRQCGAEPGIVAIVVYGDCQPAGSKRAFFRPGMKHPSVVDDNSKSKGWKHVVAYSARQVYQGPLLEGPLRFTATFYRPRLQGHYGSGKNASKLKASAPEYPTTKPDVLKLARAAEDALTNVVWRDDAQIVDEHLFKRWGEPARVEILIEYATPIEPAPAG